MRNTLSDLNNHLFAQLERLSDEDLKGEELNEELKRSQGVTNVAKNIISNGTLMLQANRFKDQRINVNEKLPDVLDK